MGFGLFLSPEPMTFSFSILATILHAAVIVMNYMASLPTPSPVFPLGFLSFVASIGGAGCGLGNVIAVHTG